MREDTRESMIGIQRATFQDTDVLKQVPSMLHLHWPRRHWNSMFGNKKERQQSEVLLHLQEHLSEVQQQRTCSTDYRIRSISPRTLGKTTCSVELFFFSERSEPLKSAAGTQLVNSARSGGEMLRCFFWSPSFDSLRPTKIRDIRDLFCSRNERKESTSDSSDVWDLLLVWKI